MAFSASGAALSLTFLAGNSLGDSDIAFLISLNIAIGLTTIFIAAAWAVLGPGSYLKRLFWSHLFVIVVGLGYLAGLVSIAPYNVWNDSDFTEIKPVTFILFGIAPVSLAAQLPFWFFRVFFGWQFALGSSPPAPPFSLRDIFVFTFFAALSFAGPQMALNQIESAQWFDPTSDYEEVVQPDGSMSVKQVVITDQEEIDRRLRENRQQIRLGFLSGYIAFVVLAFTISLLCFPTIPITFRPQETGAGCGLVAVYVVAWCILIGVTISVMSLYAGGGPPPSEIIFYVVFFMFTYGGLISISLSLSRNKGFRLTSPRRYRKENSFAQVRNEDVVLDKDEASGQ